MTEPTVVLPPEQPRKRRTVPLVVAGVVVLALAGGGAFAYSKLSGGGLQPADVLPASTIAYARVDLDPSASQKINALRLIRKVPTLADEAGIKSDKDDPRRLVFEDLVEQCDGLDYDDDVGPWLGDRAGVGLVGGSINQPVIALQTSDTKLATTAAKKIVACAGEDESGVAVNEDYVIVGPDQRTVDAVVKQAQKKPLSEDERFAADEENLGERGVASVWLDGTALAESPELASIAGAGTTGLEELETVTASLRAGSSTLEVAGFTRTKTKTESKPVELGALPDDTVLALGFGGGEQYAKAFEQGVEQETDPSFTTDDFSDFVEQSFGLKYPEDLRTLTRGSLTLAVGSKNLETLPTLSSPSDVSKLDIGLAVKGDKTATSDLLNRLSRLAASSLGLPLEVSETDAGAVLASNADAASKFAKKGDLGSRKSFEAAVEHPSDSIGGLFVDVGGIVKALKASSPPQDVDDFLDDLDQLSAVGASSWLDGDDQRFSLKVAFKD